MKVLVVVDMQNDFVYGSLGFPEAKEIIQPIKNKIEQYLQEENTEVWFTLDTHSIDNFSDKYSYFQTAYKNTREGKHLPVLHCIEGTNGHNLIDEYTIYNTNDKCLSCKKVNSFAIDPNDILYDKIVESNFFDSDGLEVEIVGLVTNLCVISCAISFQTAFSNTEITIDATCCRSFNKELHEKALDIMEGLQMKVINR